MRGGLKLPCVPLHHDLTMPKAVVFKTAESTAVMQTPCRRRFLECTSYPAGIMSYRHTHELTWSTFLRSRPSEVFAGVQ